MKTLISPTEALRRAFRSDESLAADMLIEADVVIAEQRYLRPVLGAALHDRLLRGDDAAFVQDFLADAVARFSRIVAHTRHTGYTSRVGLLAPNATQAKAADAATVRKLCRELRREGKTLLRRAVDYIETHASDFPEYEADQSLFHTCSTDGGFVQIF